jgi:hypothetical protein
MPTRPTNPTPHCNTFKLNIFIDVCTVFPREFTLCRLMALNVCRLDECRAAPLPHAAKKKKEEKIIKTGAAEWDVVARIQLKSGQLFCCAVCIVSSPSFLRRVSLLLLLLVIYVCIVAPKVCKLPNSLSVMFQHELFSVLHPRPSFHGRRRNGLFPPTGVRVLYFLYQQRTPLLPIYTGR